MSIYFFLWFSSEEVSEETIFAHYFLESLFCSLLFLQNHYFVVPRCLVWSLISYKTIIFTNSRCRLQLQLLSILTINHWFPPHQSCVFMFGHLHGNDTVPAMPSPTTIYAGGPCWTPRATPGGVLKVDMMVKSTSSRGQHLMVHLWPVYGNKCYQK